jgi:hypothetical protein
MQLTVEGVFRDAQQLHQETLLGVELRSKLHALARYAIVGSALYGLTMGVSHSPAQACLSALKTPLLFLVTLAICLPTLHFVGLLFGATTRIAQTLTAVLSGITRTCVLLGALSPIPLLFAVSHASYRFQLLLHVMIFGSCGVAGIRSMITGLTEVPDDASATPVSREVLRAWVVLYMFVGAQTAYLLSPFIGRETKLHLLNPYPGSVFSYLVDHLLRH